MKNALFVGHHLYKNAKSASTLEVRCCLAASATSWCFSYFRYCKYVARSGVSLVRILSSSHREFLSRTELDLSCRIVISVSPMILGSSRSMAAPK